VVELSPEITMNNPALLPTANLWAKVQTAATYANGQRRMFHEYIFSHYNTVEWVFTVRALILAFFLLFIPSDHRVLDVIVFPHSVEHLIGYYLLALGLYGCCVSAQCVRNYWLNVIFAFGVFSISLVLAGAYVRAGVFGSPLPYIHFFDLIASGWLIKRVMLGMIMRRDARSIHHR
jgi:hypothetical protein